MDTVTVEVETTKGVDYQNDTFKTELREKIKNTIGLSMNIDLKSHGSIPRSQGGKLSRIDDRRG